MKNTFLFFMASLMMLAGCGNHAPKDDSAFADASVEVSEIMPITGTFINLPYQDVRNKYTNPQYLDNTEPAMWVAKVDEMKKMGMEFIVLMSVANEGKSFYPSKMMGWQYPEWRKSPVDAIMDAAAERGMKVFMSTS